MWVYIMNKLSVVSQLVSQNKLPRKSSGIAFAPSNIALCKYWGKRDCELNLPVTGSLSISLGNKGANTEVSIMTNQQYDIVNLNEVVLDKQTEFYKRVVVFLDLFRPRGFVFRVSTNTNLPVGAGIASSACGFASLTMALDDLFDWQLSEQALSILARLGSGSAARSLWQGFVEWEVGIQDDGMDSFAKPLSNVWPEFQISLIVFSSIKKKISSRNAMELTRKTSPFYLQWSERVKYALLNIKKAIVNKDFEKLGEFSEANSLEMHGLMMTTQPSIVYSLSETILCQQAVWQAREDGLPIYFTQDAGPNLKLLFLKQDLAEILMRFPGIEAISPWERNINVQQK